MSTRDALASTALLGTTRAGLDAATLTGVAADLVGALREADAPATLLAAAAAVAVARRATPPVAPVASLHPPAPPEERTVAGVRVAARGARLAAETDPAGPHLMLEWLTALHERDLIVPPRLLETLLTYAATAGAVAPAVVAVIGHRGHWLAARNPTWRPVVAAHGPIEIDLTGDVADDSRWSHGTTSERARWWRALRALDADRARQLLTQSWPTLKAEEKASFLDTIATDVSASDETLLQLALLDKAASVRRTAARALTLLPDSTFARECAARAVAAVRVERRMLREHLTLTLPTTRESDPFPPAPPGVGPGAHLLTELVACTALPTWTDRLGRDPRQLVRLALDAGAGELVTGWARAAVTQHDSSWASALLEASAPGAWTPDHVRLIALVNTGEQNGLLTQALGAVGKGKSTANVNAIALIDAIPGPWTPELTLTVATAIAGGPGDVWGWGVRDIATNLATSARPDETSEHVLRRAGANLTNPAAVAALTRAADIVHQRRLTFEELS